MERKFRVAVAAHDKKKEELFQFLKENRQILDKFEWWATRAQGLEIQRRTKVRISFLDQGAGTAQEELNLLLRKKLIDGVIFLRESVSLYSYELNINEINLACDEFNIPMATNTQTGRAILGQILGTQQQSAEKTIKFTYDHLVTVLGDFKEGILSDVKKELDQQAAMIRQLSLSQNQSPGPLKEEPTLKKLSKEEEMNEILAHLYQEKKANAYVLRKRFGMGYNRAVKIIAALEKRELIGPAGADGNREVFIKDSDFQ